MRFCACILSCLILIIPCTAETITVDDDGPADYSSIQTAIDNSTDDDTIEVQPGTYFERINFYGKRITITGTEPDNINTVYTTVIDGGISGNTVTFDSGEDNTSVLEGVTVQNGFHGIYCYYSDPIISKCLIRYAGGRGIEGINASPKILDCAIRENASIGISGCQGEIERCRIEDNDGGGVNDCDNTIVDCTVSRNAGIGLSWCSGPITNCTVDSNRSHGMYRCHGTKSMCRIVDNEGWGTSECEGRTVNCVIAGNKNGGVRANSNQSCEIANCTIVGNFGDGITQSSATVTNSIIVSNWLYGISSGNVTSKYCNIWDNLSGNYSGVAPGETDTHEDPLFAIDGYWDDEDNWVHGDYRLKSIAGRWSDSGWTNDEVTSPCIDAGDPTGGYLLEPVPNGNRINQGAYGGTIHASKSPFGPEPYCGEHIPYDTNDDCMIDFTDFAAWASYWMDCNLVPQSACWE